MTTSYKIVLDSFAWWEYARGSEMGKLIEDILVSLPCITPAIVLAELSNRFHRDNKVDDWNNFFTFITTKSKIINLDAKTANESGLQKLLLRRRVKEIGLADAIIYQVALNNDARLVTGDEHFESFDDVIYLKKLDKAKAKIQEILAQGDEIIKKE